MQESEFRASLPSLDLAETGQSMLVSGWTKTETAWIDPRGRSFKSEGDLPTMAAVRNYMVPFADNFEELLQLPFGDVPQGVSPGELVFVGLDTYRFVGSVAEDIADPTKWEFATPFRAIAAKRLELTERLQSLQPPVLAEAARFRAGLVATISQLEFCKTMNQMLDLCRPYALS